MCLPWSLRKDGNKNMKQFISGKSMPAAKKEKRPARIRLWMLAGLMLAAGLLAVLPSVQQHADRKGLARQTPAPAATVSPSRPPEVQSARQIRETAYQKDLATLRELSADETVQEETRQQAARQIERMVAWHQMELGLEEMLFSAGFSPCMVLIQNDALTVAVSASEITAAESAVILSICLAHTEIAAENIRIMAGGLQS